MQASPQKDLDGKSDLSLASLCTQCNRTADIKDGVCDEKKWWVKCPPQDGNSHFENLQSTNWNSLRFKNPPTVDTDIGWRVEFRPMDIQLTDFENTALTVMVGMLANIINEFDLDIIVPITMVDENMKRAHARDAASQAKFWWKVPRADQADALPRQNDLTQTQFLLSNSTVTGDKKRNSTKQNDEADRYKELYIWQILEGDASVGMPVGIITFCEQYMDMNEWPEDKIAQTMTYLKFLSMRARGTVPTGARFLRDFVLSHADYKQDSFLTTQMQYDLMKMLDSLDGPANEAKRLLLKEFA